MSPDRKRGVFVDKPGRYSQALDFVRRIQSAEPPLEIDYAYYTFGIPERRGLWMPQGSLTAQRISEGAVPYMLRIDPPLEERRPSQLIYADEFGTVREKPIWRPEPNLTHEQREQRGDWEDGWQFAQDLGYDLVSGEGVYEHMRKLRQGLGRRWPRDLVVPDGPAERGRPSEETVHLFQRVVRGVANKRFFERNEWSELGARYFVETASRPDRPPIIRLQEISSGEDPEHGIVEHVAQWELTPRGVKKQIATVTLEVAEEGIFEKKFNFEDLLEPQPRESIDTNHALSLLQTRADVVDPAGRETLDHGDIFFFGGNTGSQVSFGEPKQEKDKERDKSKDYPDFEER